MNLGSEGSYKLPKDWRWVKLGEVCEYLRQSIDPRRYPDKEFLLYSIPAYDTGREPERVKGAEVGSTKLKIESEICLFSKLNPRIPRAWIIKSIQEKEMLIASTEFIPLKPYKNIIDLEYLGHVLLTEAFMKQVKCDVTGATGSRQRLKPKVILEAFIPLPPLPEQRRIVARIEELMERVREAKRLRAEAKKDADLLMQSALAEVFPHPGSPLPHGWRWVWLEEICKVIPGQHVLSKEYSHIPNGVPYITGPADFGTKYPTISKWTNSPKAFCQPGDVLLTVKGAGVGKVNCAPPNLKATIGRQIMALRPDPTYVLTEFLYNFLRVHFETFQAMGRSATVPGIRKDQIKRFSIPLPPLSEQRRIVAYLDQVQKQVTALKQAQQETESELERLDQAILDKAFRGEL